MTFLHIINQLTKDEYKISSIVKYTIILWSSIFFCIISFIGGIETEISKRITSVNGNYRIIDKTSKVYDQAHPIDYSSIKYIENESYIKKTEKYISVPILLSNKNCSEGIIFKGIENHLDNKFIISKTNYKDYNDIVISRCLANKLNVKLDDKIKGITINNRIRNFRVVAIYETEIDDIDNNIVYGSIKLASKLKELKENEIDGLILFIKDDQDIPLKAIRRWLYDKNLYDYKVIDVKDEFLSIFDWVLIIKQNISIYLIILLMVIITNIISITIIILLRSKQKIIILKQIGMKSSMIRNIFTLKIIKDIVKYMIYGNIIGTIICSVQKYFKLIKINSNDYYLSVVPIQFDIIRIFCINLIIVFSFVFVILITSRIIENNKIIRYEQY